MFAILCDARNKNRGTIDTLALVDRSKDKTLFWTSDDPFIMKVFANREAAKSALSKLRFNSPRVVSLDSALESIQEQQSLIGDDAAYAESECGWDAHKR